MRRGPIHHLQPILLLACAGCGDEGQSSPLPSGSDGKPSSLVVGLLSDFTPGADIERVQFVLQAAGQAVREGDLTAGDPDRPLSFPQELRFDHFDAGTPLVVELAAFGPGDTVPFLTRRAETESIGLRTMLLPIRLERECVPGCEVFEGVQTLVCEAPATCIAGSCENPHISGGALEIYSPDWADPRAHHCPGDGEPSIEFGEGQGAFESLNRMGEIHVEGGPQGGFHMYAAIRAQNMRRIGAITTIVLYAEDGQSGEVKSAIPLEFAADGMCGFYGLRVALPYDNDTTLPWKEQFERVSGTKYRVDAKLVDGRGEVAVTSRSVIVSKDVDLGD